MASPDVIGHGQAPHAQDIGLKQFKPLVIGFRGAFPDLKVTIDHTVEQGDKGGGSLDGDHDSQG